MPILLLLGSGAVGGAWLWNKVDDRIIDPITGTGDRPFISTKTTAALVGVAALGLLAYQQKWI